MVAVSLEEQFPIEAPEDGMGEGEDVPSASARE